MKKSFALLITVFALYACAERSTNPEPKNSKINKSRTVANDDCSVVATAEIVSKITDKNIPGEYMEIYALDAEIVAVAKVEKTGELIGIAGVEPDELEDQKVEFVEQKCYDEFYQNARAAMRVVIRPGSTTLENLKARLVASKCC